MSRAFKRKLDGSMQVSLQSYEAELLVIVLQNLRDVVTEPRSAGPISKRLYPSAYLDPTEERAEAQFRGDAHGALVADRLAAIDAMLAALESASSRKFVLAPGTEQQWLTALNDARLVLGTAGEITEDLELDDLDLAPEDPRMQTIITYGWLTELQQDLVEVLLDDLPDTPEEPDPLDD